ncbi:hypothetical protein QFC24_007032 [Naganishia onofrii]|uniref:Uncharacterized protein n=1 Tax=Naganishia onofrii TaxID=1851511 RepID=A0ACC2WV64_9TREE|nr:hypothetical protein QFC24_007032 [Naganishia onofrii]
MDVRTRQALFRKSESISGRPDWLLDRILLSCGLVWLSYRSSVPILCEVSSERSMASATPRRLATAWKYFVGGIRNPIVWEELWWPSAIQDGLIPIMAFTSQCYFGRRAYILLGRRRWFLWVIVTWSSVTGLCGVALAATAYAWAHTSRAFAIPSQVVTTLWMGLSALLDGLLTTILICCLWRSRSPSLNRTNDLIRQMITLTLETVLLTHICGAVMCVLFLSQPAQHRTKTTAFWICLEIITELYALSIVFTINARSSSRQTFHGAPPPSPALATPAQSITQQNIQTGQVTTENFIDPRRLDFVVEGMQDVSRFSYHFPASTAQGAAATDIDEGVEDELLELSVLPLKGNEGSAPMDATKKLAESVSLSETKNEEQLGNVKKGRKRISRWGKGL